MRHVLLTIVLLSTTFARADGPVSFARDVAPILSQRCVACHGARKPQGRYRLDTFAELLKPGSSKDAAIVPKKPDESLLYELITSEDDDERMPQDDDRLSKSQIETIRRWIKEGAKFDGVSRETHVADLGGERVHPPAPKTYRAAVPVLAVSISPNGKEIASAGYREVLVWNAESNELVRRLDKLPARIASIAHSKDGKHLLVGGGAPGDYGQTLLVANDGSNPPQLLHKTNDLVTSVALTSDGKLAAVGSADRTVTVIRLTDREVLWTAKMHSEAVTDVAFRRDGKLLASSSKDMTVKIYDVASGALFTTHRGHNRNIGKHRGHHKVFALTFDPLGTRAISAGEGPDIQLWNPEVIKREDGTAADLENRFSKEATIQRIRHGARKNVLALRTRGKLLFAALGDGVVKVYELTKGNQLKTFDAHPDHVLALDYHEASDRLVTACFDGKIRVFRLREDSEPRVFVGTPLGKLPVSARQR
ncbi:MAG: c-type cytochrome domain-containing protein [Planctomycetota bacterium]